MRIGTKREVFVWSGIALVFVAVIVLVNTFNRLLVNAQSYISEMQHLKDLHSDPPSQFGLEWQTEHNMRAWRENRQHPQESPRELAERTLSDVMEIQKAIPNMSKE